MDNLTDIDEETLLETDSQETLETGQEEVDDNELLDVYPGSEDYASEGEEVSDETNVSDEASDEASDEEQTGEEAGAEEEDIIVVPYLDAEGVERNFDLPVSDIKVLVEKARFGIEAEEYLKKTEEYIAAQSNAITVGHAVIKDPLIKQVFLWKANGFSDVQVAKFLNTHFTSIGEDMNDQVVEQAEQGEVDQALVSAIEKANKPLRDNLEKLQYEAAVRNAEQRNNEVIHNVCAELGIPKEFTKEENELFYKTFKEVLPDWKNTNVLTPRQFAAVIKESGIYDKYKKTAEQPKAAVKQPDKPAPKATVAQPKGNTAPKIAQGKPTSQPAKKTEPRSKSPEAVYARLGF